MSDAEEQSERSDNSDSSVSDPEEDVLVPADHAASDVAFAANYERIGSPVAAPPPPLSLEDLRDRHPEAFSSESELALHQVLEELELNFALSAFQQFCVNALLNKVDVVGIMPTGSGKSLVFYLYSLAIRKLPPGFRGIPEGIRRGGIVVVSMPLSMIIQAQISNPYGVKVATLNMAAEVAGTAFTAVGNPSLAGEGGQIPESELINSVDYHLLFLHPESADHDRGRKLLRNLKGKDKVAALLVDEVHLGLSNHWESFRPGMLTKVMSLKAYLVDGAPLAVFSATLTHGEVKSVKKYAGRKKPMAVVAVGPMLNNTKICVLKRPPSQIPFLGKDDVSGRDVPGLLALLKRLVLNKFVAAASAGSPFHHFKKTIIFFRSMRDMLKVNGWLISQLGGGRFDSSLFCMNHSNVSKSGQAVIRARLDSYLLFLTTSRMLLGLDVAGIKQVIMASGMNKVN